MRMARAAAAPALVWALLLALSPAQGRVMLQATRASCEVTSSATLNLVGSGSGSASGKSVCQARAAAEDAVEKIVTEWCDVMFNEKGGCSRVEVENVVRGVAAAYASVLAEVQVEAEIFGTGEACASGRAEGDAVGLALLDVAVESTVSAVKDKHGKKVSKALKKSIEEKVNEGVATAEGRAITVIVAEAWARAYDGVCAVDGGVGSTTDSFAEEITKAYAELWAHVAIELCEEAGLDTDDLKEWQSSLAEADSLSQGSLETSTESTTRGDAEVGGTQPGQCVGEYAVCCETTGAKCECGSGCVAFKSGLSSGVVTWTSRSQKCFCL